ncbi:MAG: hypothetical protein V9E96_09050 [Chitinophagaceae bacterium]
MENKFLTIDNNLVENIKHIILSARKNVYQKVNQRTYTYCYWANWKRNSKYRNNRTR